MTKREAEVERNISNLIEHFEHHVVAFENASRFRRGAQKSHADTIRLRRTIGSAAVAACRADFVRALYETLKKMGLGMKGSKLVPVGSFARVLGTRAKEIGDLDGKRIDDPELDTATTSARVWDLIKSLDIVENDAKLVAGTKTLHHLLPDLVVPMDRTYTRRFFGWNDPQFQYNQAEVFQDAFVHFARLARATDPAQFVNEGEWRTSRTKILDNALVAFCLDRGLVTRPGARPDLAPPLA